MVVVENQESDGSPCSGVLCVIDGLAGILTARHVWERLSAAHKLVIMLGPKQPYRIETELLSSYAPLGINVGDMPSVRRPDIAFIPIPGDAKMSIEARNKAFYFVEKPSRESDLDLYGDTGFWLVIGTPVEMMKRPARSVSSLSYTTDVESVTEQDGWDYLYVNLNLQDNHQLPANLEGMSGGGVWRVRFTVSISNKPRQFYIDPQKDVLLQGVTFLQTKLDGRQLIAHGPKSIYERLPKFIKSQRGKV